MTTPLDTSTVLTPQRDDGPVHTRRWRVGIQQLAVRHWECILQFALVLWVVRVPLITTALGLLLLGWTPQAQDLFVEFTLRSPIPLLPFLFVPPLSALFFLFVLIAVWALPTHYAARLLVDSDSGFQAALAEERDLEQQDPNQTQHAVCLECSAVLVPRLLGFFTFVAVLLAILRSYLNMPNLEQHEVTRSVGWALVEMALLVATAAIGYVVYVIKRPRSGDVPILRQIKRLNAKLALFWRFISPGQVGGTADEEARNLGRLILLGIFVVFVGIFLLGSDNVGTIFPRAMAVPFILGGWLPFLSYLSGLGRQWRAPLIVGTFALIVLLVLVLGDNHSVRRLHADGDTKSIPLQDAVTMWMQANDCDTTPAACPRPIILAAAGGASRAGFFMATVIGYFMQEADSHGLDANQVRNRLFAISSVSGGSMGAVMVTAALNATRDSRDHPCIEKPVDQWWGETIGNWRDCFEALTSGDFLTANFFGLAFNDMLPFGRWRDRAAVLEDSWRNRYRKVVTDAGKLTIAPSCEGLDCPFLTLRPSRDHWIPLLVLNGTSEATGGRIVTTLLALNYAPQTPNPCPTAVGPSGCQLFVQADRFHELLDTDVKPDRWFGWMGAFERRLLGDLAGNDVRLSTAAHNSARFPLISPPGSVRNSKQMIVDRIVDGGYFESYGALSAKEVALAVHAVQVQLKPLVIVISNDPTDLLDPSDDSGPMDQPKSRRQVSASELVTDIVTPVMTVGNARTAHGILGVAELRSALHAAITDCSVLVIQVRVWPDYGKTLSMSWWESALVQRQLHRQTEQRKDPNEEGHDYNKNDPHLQAIWEAMKDSRCVTKE